MHYCKFPTFLVNYSHLMVKEVWTMIHQGITLATANSQVCKVLPFMPIVAVTPPDWPGAYAYAAYARGTSSTSALRLVLTDPDTIPVLWSVLREIPSYFQLDAFCLLKRMLAPDNNKDNGCSITLKNSWEQIWLSPLLSAQSFFRTHLLNHVLPRYLGTPNFPQSPPTALCTFSPYYSATHISITVL